MSIRNHTGLEPAPEEEKSSGIPKAEEALLRCDLTTGKSFFPDRHGPPVPILTAFGAGRMHQCRLHGKWDFEQAIAERPDALIRSFRILGPTKKADAWEDVIFQFGRRAFLCGSPNKIVGYAATQGAAEQIVREFTESYGDSRCHAGGSFQLIRQDHYGIKCENVTLGRETVLSEGDFALHYPADGEFWHRGFVEKLLGRRHGLSILEGAPGTGKTSYLRHLMGALKESHRFYFIPPSTLSILSKPDFVGFWSGERQSYEDRKLVVILEDADGALMTRESDNREQVSAILNLSDGMLGDFLRLQIICTINCRASDIDQALLRPGRLLCHRVFERLDTDQATRLAASIGRTLPEARDYSLAEVFSGEESAVMPRPHIGFGGTK